MKRILLINTKYRTFGGEDANIIDELGLLKEKYIVEYLEYDNSERVNFFDVIGFFTNSNFSSNKKLQKKIDSFNPDVAYVHNTWFKSNLGIFKVLKKNNIQTLHKIHSFRFDCSRFILSSSHLKSYNYCPACNLNRNKVGFINKYFVNSYFKSILLIIYSKKYFKLITKSNFKLLVISDFHKEYLLRLGLPKSKIYLYSNPINLSNSVRRKYKSDSNYFVYAGRLDSSKGVEELIKAWLELGLTDFKLLIIGDGDLKTYLINSYRDKSIEFLDKVDNDEVQGIISESKAVITATRMYEGQPRLLCEASSLGIPSIYPSFGGMNELFPEGYEYSFKQFDYTDLKTKVLMLTDPKISTTQSKLVYEYISDRLNTRKMLNMFSKIAFGEDY